ncbi:TetR family transcriptional regulator [Comamonas serinivorans]|uniref:TetR family transcriptional regulator n=1 Tax=Comamonas serinivorans TaxID=1082851 RepID=A0A1Y0ETJ1_9BURK|nr:TetR/AcrR family transcriptional regulator [Comamonas serinivorans]ARU06848.1 TetR family transcriptional regulator [Comamonas serinivorans]
MPPPPADPSPKSLAILEAASRVFLAHGFSAATTDMIQREAKVSKATMYACFPTKEALFAAVIERQCAGTHQAVSAIAVVPGNLAKTLTDIGLAYLRIVLSPEGLALLRVIVADAPRFPDLARRFHLAGPRVIIGMLAERLGQAAQAGEVNVQAVGIDAAAALFISLVRGEGQLECLMHPESHPSAEQLDRWVRLAVTTFMAAFGTPGRGTQAPASPVMA